jgi:hypothetical protein
MTEDWSTSSYSGYNGDCVQARWRKASASASNGHCAQVRMANGTVQVRDSKNPDGGMLKFTRAEWESFTAGLRAQA